MARIGIYGGSFNPPHSGHVKAAGELVELLQLDKLLVIPAANPPHKTLPNGSPTPEQRFALCRLAFDAIDKAEVSDLELKRSGASYTADTLAQLKARYPKDELYLIMGTDMALTFPQWYQPQKIASMATLAVMHRTGSNPQMDAALDTALTTLRQDLHATVVTVDNHPIATSSTEVRTLIAMDCLKGLLVPSVAAVIAEHGYYGYGENRKGLPFDRLMAASIRLHNPKRVPHVIGCCETAQLLAKRFGAEETDAARAGILHDVTKALGTQAQLLLCDRYAVPRTESEHKNPKLLHAKTGAAVAEHVFGENPAVCDAIFWHTTGKADMTQLEKIIYLADYMEPNRDFDGVETLRKLAETDLDAACLEGFRMSLELLRQRGSVIDPNSLQAWQYLAKEREKTE